jgi:hypothetical protein
MVGEPGGREAESMPFFAFLPLLNSAASQFSVLRLYLFLVLNGVILLNKRATVKLIKCAFAKIL